MTKLEYLPDKSYVDERRKSTEWCISVISVTPSSSGSVLISSTVHAAVLKAVFEKERDRGKEVEERQ